MGSLLKRIYRASVFSPLRLSPTLSDALATLFHRSAVTLYLLFLGWAVAGWTFDLDPLTQRWGATLQDSYSILVGVTAIGAAYGATFFSRNARLEMFAASALTTLFFVYIGAIGYDILVFGENHLRGALFFLTLTVPVVPIARIVFIYLLLLRTAKGAPR